MDTDFVDANRGCWFNFTIHNVNKYIKIEIKVQLKSAMKVGGCFFSLLQHPACDN